jgi:cytochrome c oxidase cbb3-type subunit 3
MPRWLQCASIQLATYLAVSAFAVACQSGSAIGQTATVTADGKALFGSVCSGCHGIDGRGGEHAPNIAVGSQAQNRSDQDVVGIVQNGVRGAGMPAFDSLGHDRILGIVAYLRILQGRGISAKLPGDAVRGESLFFGKGQCSDCHMANGRGGFIASDLSVYGRDVTAEQIRHVILDPDKTLPSAKKATTVVTHSGQAITGMVKAEDNFSISIQAIDGSFHFLEKTRLAKIDSGSSSLMPTNYGSRLSKQEVDDLISYLLRSSEKLAGSQTSKDATDDDDEE